ncbi:MAG: acetolactate synthase-1/2/3 large subunit [Cellvibrionaceae bacterium]|jgi:acetolactate synthase-1/2/3 large subunit
MTHNVASIILDGMEAVGIKTLYCLPGVQNDNFFNVLYDRTDTFGVINTRHEQGAAYMAMGAAIATGEPQAYSVVPGPGMLNASGALVTAFGLAQPVFALHGQINSHMMGKMTGQLHEVPDQLAILKQITKHSAGVYDSEMAVETVETAFSELISGMPRPVGFEVPMDVWASPVDGGELPLKITKTVPDVNMADIEAAAKLLGEAQNPLVIVGAGAQHVSAEVTQLVEMLQAPINAWRTGRGIVDARHPLYVNWNSFHELWKTADVVVGIGTRLQSQQMGWGVDENLKLIQINIDAEELNRHGTTTVAVHADAADALPALLEKLPSFNRERFDRSEEMAALEAQSAENLAYLEPQNGFLRAIRKALPEDGIFVEDLTQTGFVARIHFPVYQPRTYISSGYPGTLGWGYATALGVQHAMPDRKVVLVSGDGGFMYTVAEVSTAVKYNIPLVAIVFADGAYGNVKRIQQERFNNRTIASDLHNPDFVKLAESFGALGLRATNEAELEAAIEEGFAANRPTIIEVPVGEMPSPWPLIMQPKVRM